MDYKIMQRPMFKLGGKAASQGTGITSGLDERVNYSNGTQYQKFLDSALDKIDRREAAMDSLNDLYNLQALAGASNLAGQITTDNPLEAGLQLLRGAPSIVLPLMSQRKKLELQKLDPKTDLALAKAFKPSGGLGEKVYQTKLRNLGKLEEQELKLREQLEKNEISQKDYNEGMKLLNRRFKMINSQILTEYDFINMARDELKGDYGSIIPEEVLQDRVKELKRIYSFSEGGRVNRMMGSPKTGEMADDPKPLPSDPTEPVNPFKPKPIKPLGDMADKGNDTYAMLRARLPAEIPDDVVSLISYNPEAFADFASIENQEDVKSFNEKYGMELVIDVATV